MKKIISVCIALSLLGSAFFSGGWSRGTVRDGVTVDGLDVGGLTYAAAETRYRENFSATYAPFTVHTDEGDVRFATDFRDDLSDLLRHAKKNDELHAKVTRVWVTLEDDLAALCARMSYAPRDAVLSFSSRGFSYESEQKGRACDYPRLLRDVLHAMDEGKSEATLLTRPVGAAVTEEALRARTRPLASYTTYYSGGSPRAHNIALACSRLSGTEIGPHGELSFNAAVGKRTRENGFEEAAVISGGEYVQGVGGGVCQASTTLMNAALLAGLKVTESRPHSLTVGYVPPSRDAMVSEFSDLKIVNPYDVPVYLLGLADGGRIRFTFYGLPDGKTYEIESKILLVAPPPEDKIVEGDEDKVLRAAKEGVASESYLLVYENGTLLSRTLLRRDTYAVVQGIRQVKKIEN